MATSSVCTITSPSFEIATPRSTKAKQTMDEAAVERRGSMDLSAQPPGTVYLGTGKETHETALPFHLELSASL